MPEVTIPEPLTAVYSTRRENLRLLAKAQINGEAKALAPKLGFSVAYLTQLIGRNPSRTITERTARAIETKMGLTYGWLDMVRGE